MLNDDVSNKAINIEIVNATLKLYHIPVKN